MQGNFGDDCYGGMDFLRSLTGGDRVACRQPGCIQLQYNIPEYQQILK